MIENSRRLHATSAIGRLLSDLLSPAARRRGFAQAAVLAEWDRIVGPMLAARCQPVRLAFERGRTTHGVLFLRARGGAALELQHATLQICERVNDYMGYPAVARVHLMQVPLPRPTPLPRPAPRAPCPTRSSTRGWRRNWRGVEDPDLRAVLHRLGRAVAGTRRR